MGSSGDNTKAAFTKLVVWQKALELCLTIYKATNTFPNHERYGLSAELRKTARSVVCNIAEGQCRPSRREFARFLDISWGSAAELRTQLIIAEALHYLAADEAQPLLVDIDQITKMLAGLKKSLLLP